MQSEIERFLSEIERLKASIAARIVGQEGVVDEVLVCLVAGGHALLEGAPGLGKTMLVRSLAEATSLAFSRIQFTPDLMPSDITGTHVVLTDERGQRRFELAKGPIFGQLVLADEINRATPKTQSALLEAMAERSVTIAGERHTLEPPFFVLATENPIEMEGTYPLPEAQLDRFLLKILVPTPDEATLVSILARTTGNDARAPEPVLDAARILEAQRMARDVVVAEPLVRWVARLVRASDPSSGEASPRVRALVRYGAGVRGAQSMILAAKARALLSGRGHVGRDDLLRVAAPALRHRLVPSFEAEAEGVSMDAVVERLLEDVPALPASVAAMDRP